MKRVYSSFEAHQACKEGYFVVIACGNGLWTTGGHFILAVGANDTEIEIYDPYLYNGKFNINGRQGKVRLDGISAWVEINTFKSSSNAQRFFAFKIDENSQPQEPTQPTKTTAWINTENLPLNVRDDARGDASIIGSLPKGTQVTVYEQKDGWSKVDQGWVSSSYLTYSAPSSIPNTVGQTKKFVGATTIYKNSNLTGETYDYKANTSVIVLGNVSANIDKIRVIQTNREGYVSTSVYGSTSNSSVSTGISGYRLGRYKVTASGLNVRTGAGTKGTTIKRTYSKGTVFDTYEIKGNWARTPSGWVCLDYCTLLYKY